MSPHYGCILWGLLGMQARCRKGETKQTRTMLETLCCKVRPQWFYFNTLPLVFQARIHMRGYDTRLAILVFAGLQGISSVG